MNNHNIQKIRKTLDQDCTLKRQLSFQVWRGQIRHFFLTICIPAQKAIYVDLVWMKKHFRNKKKIPFLNSYG